MKQLGDKFLSWMVRQWEWIKEYLREISVIILGLCITYYGDSLMDDYTERKEDEEALRMVCQELEANFAELQSMQAYYTTDIQFSVVYAEVVAKGIDHIDEDSVHTFYNQHRLYHYWTLKDYAFKMVRESQTMQRMDKILLAQIFECYEYLNVVEDMGRKYRDKRFEELLLFIRSVSGNMEEDGTVLCQWKQIAKNKEFSSYLVTMMPMMAKSGYSICLYASGVVQETLDSIRRAYSLLP